jgi:predicted N-acetyltransferase YhbS
MTTQSGLRFDEIEPREQPLLFEFYSSTLPNAERIRALYAWRQAGREAAGGIRTIAARDGSAIVGAISMLPLGLGVAGSRLSAAWQFDTVVSVDHRGQGIAKKLVDAGAEGLQLVAAKGTQPVMYALRKKLGFHDVPNSTFLLRALSPLSLGGSLRKRLGVALFYLIALVRRGRSRPSSLRTLAVPRFEWDFDTLCETILGGAEVTPVKDSRYLNWRYTECPGRSYLVIRAEEPGGRLRGAAVIRPNDGPYLDAWLVDMIVGVDDQEAQHALLDATLRQLRLMRAACVRTFATSPSIRRALLAHGFMDTGATPRFTYRAGAPLGDFGAAPWNIWHGDGDTELHD